MKTFLTAALLAASTLAAGAASATPVWIEKGIHLNARSGPGAQYHKLGTFDPCTRVHAVAYHHGWAKVVYNHHAYWVSAKYLRGSSCHTPKRYHYGY